MLNIENISNIFQPNFDLLVSLFVFASISLIFYFLALKIILIRKYLTQKYVFLEIRPTDRTLKTSLSTTQLFNILHSLEKPYTWFERFIKFKKNISYELVSTKQDGIRFILRTPKEDASSIRKTLLAYLSGIEIKEISDYLDHKSDIQPHSVTRELILGNPYIYTLTAQSNLIQHDPLAYLTAHMTKLWPNEVVVLQFVCTSVDKNTHAKETSLINELSKKLLNNEDISSILNGGNYNYIFDFIGTATAFIVLTPVTLISWLVSGSEQPFPSWIFKSNQKTIQKSNGTTKTELYTNIATKISQPLFETTIRVYISSNTRERSVERLKGIVSSFDTFSSQYQSVKLKRSIFKTIKQKSLQKLYYLLLENRLSLFTSRTILSADELSSMYHLPFTSTTKTEDLLQVKSPKLPAPISLKKSDLELDITFAQNVYGETTTPIGLTLEERRRHAYIIGSTGTGKTTLLLQMIYQDINKGNGFAVIDPHGDLAERLIGVIPEDRINDVIYFNPYDIEFPIGLNVLEIPKGLSDVGIIKNDGKKTFFNDINLGYLCEKAYLKTKDEILCLSKIDMDYANNQLLDIDINTLKTREIYKSKELITDFTVFNDQIYIAEIDLYTKKSYVIVNDTKIDSPTIINHFYQKDNKLYFVSLKSELNENTESYYLIEDSVITKQSEEKIYFYKDTN